MCVRFQKFTGLLSIIPSIHPSIFQAACPVCRAAGCWILSQHFGPHQLFFTENRQSSANITRLDIKKICYICANCISGGISPRAHRLHAQTGEEVDRMCKRCNHIFVELYRTSSIKSSRNPPGNETGTQLSKFHLEIE